jgi:gas vesicle protein
MSEEKGELKGMLLGLLLGAAVGTVLGILIAPAAGSETRHKLKTTLEDIPEKAKRTTARIKDFIRHKKEEIGAELETEA